MAHKQAAVITEAADVRAGLALWSRGGPDLQPFQMSLPELGSDGTGSGPCKITLLSSHENTVRFKSKQRESSGRGHQTQVENPQ